MMFADVVFTARGLSPTRSVTLHFERSTAEFLLLNSMNNADLVCGVSCVHVRLYLIPLIADEAEVTLNMFFFGKIARTRSPSARSSRGADERKRLHGCDCCRARLGGDRQVKITDCPSPKYKRFYGTSVRWCFGFAHELFVFFANVFFSALFQGHQHSSRLPIMEHNARCVKKVRLPHRSRS